MKILLLKNYIDIIFYIFLNQKNVIFHVQQRNIQLSIK